MPVNYEDVLADLDAQIGFHESELETLRAARPAILKLRGQAKPATGRFTSMGTTAAVRALMADGELRTREQAFDELRAGGWNSDAASPIGSLGATLSQMRDELEKVEDRWRKKAIVNPFFMTPEQKEQIEAVGVRIATPDLEKWQNPISLPPLSQQ